MTICSTRLDASHAVTRRAGLAYVMGVYEEAGKPPLSPFLLPSFTSLTLTRHPSTASATKAASTMSPITHKTPLYGNLASPICRRLLWHNRPLTPPCARNDETKPEPEPPVRLKKRKLDEFALDTTLDVGPFTGPARSLAIAPTAFPGPIGLLLRFPALVAAWFRHAFRLGNGICYAVYTAAFGNKRRLIEAAAPACPSTPTRSPIRLRSILRKSSDPEATKKSLHFYASPTSGGPVSSYQEFEVVSPLPRKFSMSPLSGSFGICPPPSYPC